MGWTQWFHSFAFFSFWAKMHILTRQLHCLSLIPSVLPDEVNFIYLFTSTKSLLKYPLLMRLLYTPSECGQWSPCSFTTGPNSRDYCVRYFPSSSQGFHWPQHERVHYHLPCKHHSRHSSGDLFLWFINVGAKSSVFYSFLFLRYDKLQCLLKKMENHKAQFLSCSGFFFWCISGISGLWRWTCSFRTPAR